MTSAISVFLGLRKVSASYRDPNSCSYNNTKMSSNLRESNQKLTIRYFSEPSMSTELTTLIILPVGT